MAGVPLDTIQRRDAEQHFRRLTDGSGRAQANNAVKMLHVLYRRQRIGHAGLPAPESVWKSGDNTIDGGAALSPRARPGAPVSAQPTEEAPSPSGRGRTPTA